MFGSQELGRNYIGYEIDKRYVEIAQKRLEHAILKIK